ncbi:MAG TPA: hypothetical protein VFL69_09030 [Marmoricola sp.]|nr:hypothetical protein [Marmoricola sp.]
MAGVSEQHDVGYGPAPTLSGTARAMELDGLLGDVMRRLVQARSGDGWPVVVRAGLQVVSDADLSVLVAPRSGQPRVLAAQGLDTESWQGEEVSLSAAVLDPVIRAGMNLVLPGVRLVVGSSARIVSTLAVPVRLDRDTSDVGALLVGRLRDRRGFTSMEMAPLAQLSRRVELAFEIAAECLQRCDDRLHQDRADLALQAQRNVVAPLFTASMELANLAGAADPLLRDRLLDAVGAIDGVTGWLRNQIHGLRR